MNQLGKSNTCGICRVDFIDLRNQAGSVAVRERIQRQIFAGICDPCQVMRHRAAVEFISATEEVRTLTALGAGYIRRGTPTQALGAAMRRVQDADARCIRLKMWA